MKGHPIRTKECREHHLAENAAAAVVVEGSELFAAQPVALALVLAVASQRPLVVDGPVVLEAVDALGLLVQLPFSGLVVAAAADVIAADGGPLVVLIALRVGVGAAAGAAVPLVDELAALE